MGKYLKQITAQDVYVTRLKEKTVTNEEGWHKKVPVESQMPQTGSILFDAIGRILFETNLRQPEALAEILEVDAGDLRAAIHLLSGLTTQEFIMAYRILQAQELLECTDLPVDEIARQCGYLATTSFYRDFSKQAGTSPATYRLQHRPWNYKELYTY